MTHPRTQHEALQHAIDQLTRRQRIRLYRAGHTRAEWHTLPSLLDQLTAAAGYRGTGTGSAGGRARLPISTDVVNLLDTITRAVTTALTRHAPGQPRPTLTDAIRLLGTVIPADLADTYAGHITEWTTEARAVLRLATPRPRWAPGATCPACGADTYTAEQDGEKVRRPALSVQWTDHTDRDTYRPDADQYVRAVTCDVCQASWWRGPDLDVLVDQMLHANLTRETMLG